MDFVEGLVKADKAAGLDVWYDQAAMAWGDSIRQKTDDGLRRYLTDAGRLLPIWHRLAQDDVAQRAPSLAGRLALPTSTYSTGQIVGNC